MLKTRSLVNAVCDDLETNGYVIPSRWPPQPGIICLHKEKSRLILDCHGEEFYLPPSQRKSKHEQVRAMDEQEAAHCFALSFVKAASRLYGNDWKAEQDDILGLVFPYTESFWRPIKPLKEAVDKLGIALLLVRPDHSVMKYSLAHHAQKIFRDRLLTSSAERKP